MRGVQAGFGLVALGLSMLLPTPGIAATRSCQEVLNPPENAEQAEISADNPDSEFGPGLFDLDGAALKNMADLRAAIARTGAKVPIIKGGDFSGWKFSDPALPLANLCFFQSKMAASTWDEGKFPGIGFVEVDLASASFRNTELQGLLLREAFLTGADMRDAKLDGGLLDGGWGGGLSNWDLTGASLRGFRFQCGLTISDGCPLDRSDVKFVGADFSEADISTYPFWGQADYSGATLANTKVSPRHLTDIRNANVAGTITLTGGVKSVALSPAEFADLQRQAHMALKAEDGPSFSCDRAVSEIEKMICGAQEYGLHGWDRQLAQVYADLKARDPSIIADQRKWLASRKQCKDSVCLSRLYGARVETLLRRMGAPELLARGEIALFIDEPVSFPESFRGSTLFARIVPVLIDASLGEAVVERASDGTYSISGESIAANAHMCSVSGEGLRYDKATGWFAAFDKSAKTKPAAVFRAFRDEIEFPASGHPTEEEFPGSSDFASCGMRASLMTMKRIDTPTEILAERKAILNEGY